MEKLSKRSTKQIHDHILSIFNNVEVLQKDNNLLFVIENSMYIELKPYCIQFYSPYYEAIKNFCIENVITNISKRNELMVDDIYFFQYTGRWLVSKIINSIISNINRFKRTNEIFPSNIEESKIVDYLNKQFEKDKKILI